MDILVTPLVTIFAGVGLSMLIAAPIGAAASQVGTLIMWATEQAPFLMGILVAVIVGVALTLPISSAAICAALGLTGLAGGAAVATVAGRLGHSQPSTTLDIYTHAFDKNKKAASQVLQEGLEI